MEVIYLLNLVVSLAISTMLIIIFFKHYHNKEINHVTNKLAIIGLAHFLISILSFLWFFEVMEYASFDFLFVYSLVVLVQTVFLIMIFSMLYNRKMMLLLVFYALGLFSFLSSNIDFSLSILFISFLLLIVVFILLVDREDFSVKVSYTGLFYSSVSLIFVILDFFGIGSHLFYGFFSGLLFFFLVYCLLFYFDKFPPGPKKEKKNKQNKNKHSFFEVLKYFIFIITIVNLVFIGTVGLNEFGHYSAAKFYDCEYRSIVYGGDEGPHTEILCKDVSEKRVTLAGVLLPLIVALFLFIVGGKFIKEIALLTVGFGLLSSYKDLLDLGISDGLVITSSIGGVLFLIIGVILLSKARTEEHVREVLHF